MNPLPLADVCDYVRDRPSNRCRFVTEIQSKGKPWKNATPESRRFAGKLQIISRALGERKPYYRQPALKRDRMRMLAQVMIQLEDYQPDPSRKQTDTLNETIRQYKALLRELGIQGIDLDG